MLVTTIIEHNPRRLLSALLVLALSCAIIACDQKSSQPESREFTADELYFISAYVDVHRATGYYPHQPVIADSLLAGLGAAVDTVRINHTIAQLNTDPDRWAAVYQEIENRLRGVAKEKGSERSGTGSGAPAQVE
jgi:hypothetical protein